MVMGSRGIRPMCTIPCFALLGFGTLLNFDGRGSDITSKYRWVCENLASGVIDAGMSTNVANSSD